MDVAFGTSLNLSVCDLRDGARTRGFATAAAKSMYSAKFVTIMRVTAVNV